MSSCIFTIIKNEHQYLDEFIQYHLNIGVDHIIIAEDYDSNTHKEITDKYDNVTLFSILDFFSEDKKEIIIYRKTHHFKVQGFYVYYAFEYIHNHYKYDWLFIIDIDEYITIEDKYKNVNEVLSLYNNYDAVILQWQNYGANGLIYKPDYSKKGIIETYTEKVDYQRMDKPLWFRNVKTVYNMNRYYKGLCLSEHVPNDKSKWCKTNFYKDKDKLIYDNIYIRHYITKSFEEYINKIYIRGLFNKNHRNCYSFFDINLNMINQKEELIKWANNYIKERELI